MKWSTLIILLLVGVVLGLTLTSPPLVVMFCFIAPYATLNVKASWQSRRLGKSLRSNLKGHLRLTARFFRFNSQGTEFLEGAFEGNSIELAYKMDPLLQRSGITLRCVYDFTINPLHTIPHELTLERHGVLSRLTHPHDVLVDDPTFDDTFIIQGNHEAGIVSMFSDECREKLHSLNAMSDSLRVTPKQLEVRFTADYGDDHGPERCLDLALEITRLLSRVKPVQEQLAQNLKTSQHPSYRRRNLELLLRFPVTPEIRQNVLEPILEHDSLELRAMVASVLGGEALATVQREMLDLPLPWSVEVFRAIAVSTDPQILPILNKGIQQPELLELAAENMVRLNDARYVTLLPKLYARLPNEPKQVRLVQLAGELGDVAAEPFLLHLLTAQASDEPTLPILVATARSLGSCGTPAAIMPLIDLEHRGYGGELRTAAQESVVRIQSRIAGGSAGAVMLAPEIYGPDASQHGALSLADQSASTGALSMAEQENTAGALTLQESGERAREGVKVGEPRQKRQNAYMTESHKN